MNIELARKQQEHEKQIAASFMYKHLMPSIKDYDTICKKGVLFVEDTNSGFEFICNYIKKCYSNIDITVVSVGGSGNFKYTYAFNLDTDYDYAIFVYDRGKESKDGTDNIQELSDGIRRFKRKRKLKENFELFYFSPFTFESMLLSFEFLITEFLSKYNIRDSASLLLHKDLVAFIKNDETFDYFKYINKESNNKSIENEIEKAIEELTENTIYKVKHKPSSISNCWWSECMLCNNVTSRCNMTDYAKYNKNIKCKLEFISEYSELAGLTIIIDKLYNIKYRKYPLAITRNNKERIWGKVEV